MTNQTQTAPGSDALLKIGKIMTVLLQVVICIAIAAITVAIPFILFNTGEVTKALAEGGSTADPTMVVALITLLLVAVVAVIAAGFHFFQLLGRIIDTVSEGEPFVEVNADRLRRMGWIAVLFQLASFPIGGVAAYLSAQMPDHVDVSADIEFSLTGILLAIVLFILARVFRHGTAMRDDLEGTV